MRLFLIILAIIGIGIAVNFLPSGVEYTAVPAEELEPEIVKEERPPGVMVVIAEEDQLRPVRVAFVGDMMFDRYIRTQIEKNGFGYILEGVAPLLESADIVLGNLEGPITDAGSVSQGAKRTDDEHFTFTFPKETALALASSNIELVSLDNNHTLNFGNAGLEETKTYLAQNNVSVVGDPSDREPLIKKINNVRIGFLSYNQFVLPQDEEIADSIKALAERADFVVVYAHWGEEYQSIPNERQISLAHLFIDSGADVVIGSHPHVIQSKEVYNGSTIYYSLGNFVFDQYLRDSTRCGVLVSAIFTMYEGVQFEEKFVYLEKDGRTLPKQCLKKVPTL